MPKKSRKQQQSDAPVDDEFGPHTSAGDGYRVVRLKKYGLKLEVRIKPDAKLISSLIKNESINNNNSNAGTGGDSKKGKGGSATTAALDDLKQCLDPLLETVGIFHNAHKPSISRVDPAEKGRVGRPESGTGKKRREDIFSKLLGESEPSENPDEEKGQKDRKHGGGRRNNPDNNLPASPHDRELRLYRIYREGPPRRRRGREDRSSQ